MEDLTDVPDAYRRLVRGSAITGDPKKGSVVVDIEGVRLQFLTPKVFTKEHL